MNRCATFLSSALAVLALVPCGLPAATVIEAERAPILSVGSETGSGVWNLFSNGRVGAFLKIDRAGRYQVAVRAYGSPAASQWPRMALVVDGQTIGSVTVDQPAPRDYLLTVPLVPGAREIAVAFTNDVRARGEDRNLYLDRITVMPPAGVGNPAVMNADEVRAWAKEDERRIVEECDSLIDRHRKSNASVRVVDADGRPVAGASVEVVQTQHDFLFGCNIYGFDRARTAKDNAAYKRRFEELFNYATTGFYWRSYEPERGKPNYEYTDKVVDWCRERGIRIKGHPLLWGNQAGIPRWSKGLPSTETQRRRVEEIMHRYGGKIEFWEVVNEPAHLAEPKIDQPYRWARQTLPEAYLIVNDYHIMADGAPAFFQLLQGAIARGVPFDGIGIQAHEPRTMRFPLDRVRRELDRYATLGKELHITEFTPTSAAEPIDGSPLGGAWDEAAQADYAAKFYRVAFAHPAVRAITWWDLSDRFSWLKGGGMLRADMAPKPVYDAIKRLVHGDWETRTTGRTGADGSLSFRGFHGTYRASVTRGDREVQATFRLARGDANTLTITLP